MPRIKQKQTIFRLPVDLPVGFCGCLGYEPRQVLFAVFWEHQTESVVAFDGVSYRQVKPEPFVAMILDDRICELVERHRMRIWATGASPTHWLVVGDDRRDAWFMPPAVARQCVISQKLPEEETDPQQMRLPL